MLKSTKNLVRLMSSQGFKLVKPCKTVYTYNLVHNFSSLTSNKIFRPNTTTSSSS